MRWLIVLVVACSSERPASHDAASPEPDDAAVEIDAAPAAPRIATVTKQHRAIPGVMFGGWGPHLGHLLRAKVGESVATYWVDDACTPSVAGDCNVDINRRVAVWRHDAAAWVQLATLPLSGVQQNTAALAVGGRIYVYGIASGAQRIVECTYDIASGAGSCTTLAIPIGAFANYVGAAVGPGGSRVVWWTNVVDGGGGSFSYLVNYGGGWNGPRTGPVGGYNDCGYAHLAFAPNRVEAFCQVVAGLAPNWTFSTLVGTTSSALDAPVVWTNGLAPPANDSIASTNDLYIDASGVTHLIARSAKGAAVVYMKPAGGAYSSALVLPSTYRARFTGGLAIARDVDRKKLAIADTVIDLPEGFGDIYAIYPLSPAYQEWPVDTIELAVVGSGDEHHVLHVAL